MTTSVKAKFRPSRVKGKTGTVYFQVIHDRVARQISTGYKLFPGEWKDGAVIFPEQNPERSGYLAETYTSSVNSFLRFCREQGDIRLDEIDEELVKEYEYYLLEDCGLCRNTSSFYNRNLRAIYNRAVKKKLTIDRHPFAEVYTGVDKTAKRAISIQTVKEIKDLDLSRNAEMAFARDLYLMSFDLRGISFVDLAMLETGQLKNGYLTYSRQKTRQKLEIKWEKQMQEIVDRHHVEGSRYLLPILSEEGGDIRRQYLNALHRMNVQLKKIGKLVNCPIPLTTYTARHCWASAAYRLNIPTPSISQALGHDSEKTTRIYLDSLDNQVIDDANLTVMRAVYA